MEVEEGEITDAEELQKLITANFESEVLETGHKNNSREREDSISQAEIESIRKECMKRIREEHERKDGSDRLGNGLIDANEPNTNGDVEELRREIEETMKRRREMGTFVNSEVIKDGGGFHSEAVESALSPLAHSGQEGGRHNPTGPVAPAAAFYPMPQGNAYGAGMNSVPPYAQGAPLLYPMMYNPEYMMTMFTQFYYQHMASYPCFSNGLQSPPVYQGVFRPPYQFPALQPFQPLQQSTFIAPHSTIPSFPIISKESAPFGVFTNPVETTFKRCESPSESDSSCIVSVSSSSEIDDMLGCLMGDKDAAIEHDADPPELQHGNENTLCSPSVSTKENLESSGQTQNDAISMYIPKDSLYKERMPTVSQESKHSLVVSPCFLQSSQKKAVYVPSSSSSPIQLSSEVKQSIQEGLSRFVPSVGYSFSIESYLEFRNAFLKKLEKDSLAKRDRKKEKKEKKERKKKEKEKKKEKKEEEEKRLSLKEKRMREIEEETRRRQLVRFKKIYRAWSRRKMNPNTMRRFFLSRGYDLNSLNSADRIVFDAYCVKFEMRSKDVARIEEGMDDLRATVVEEIKKKKELGFLPVANSTTGGRERMLEEKEGKGEAMEDATPSPSSAVDSQALSYQEKQQLFKQRRKVIIPFQPTLTHIEHKYYNSDVYVQYKFILHVNKPEITWLTPVKRKSVKRSYDMIVLEYGEAIPGYKPYQEKRGRFRDCKKEKEKQLPPQLKYKLDRAKEEKLLSVIKLQKMRAQIAALYKETEDAKESLETDIKRHKLLAGNIKRQINENLNANNTQNHNALLINYPKAKKERKTNESFSDVLNALGLDNAGKTTILKKVNGEDINSISPTLGFHIHSIQYKGYLLNVWDIGGQKTIRNYWNSYYEDTDTVIWVVDSSDQERLAECKQEFKSIILEEKLAGASMVILCNKNDIKGALSSETITKYLDLQGPEFDSRYWAVFSCSAVSGNGLSECFDWIIAHSINNME